MTNFQEAIRVWVDELQVNHLHDAPFLSQITDECTDNATAKELALLLLIPWVENGSPVEHLMEFSLRRKAMLNLSVLHIEWHAHEEEECTMLHACCMGFDGAVFEAKKSGVQAN